MRWIGAGWFLFWSMASRILGILLLFPVLFGWDWPFVTVMAYSLLWEDRATQIWENT